MGTRLLLVAAAVAVALGVGVFQLSRQPLVWPRLFGRDALFDLWALQHLATGVLLAWLGKGVAQWMTAEHWRERLFLFGLIGAYLFEALELGVELGGAGPAVARWFAGLEHLLNRLIMDPLALLAGMWLYLWAPRSVVAAWLFTGVWLGMQVFTQRCLEYTELLAELFAL